jgi:hypothetical protein
MNKKERPKIYQHTSGGGHKLIHNNPSPLKDLETISLEHREVIYYNNKEFQRIKQALTDYANMVESLEGLVEEITNDMKSEYTNGLVGLYIKHVVLKVITKVLEGKINE